MLQAIYRGSLCAGYLLTASFVQAEDTFVSLFDGKTLNGWKVAKDDGRGKTSQEKGNFFAKDGALHCFQLPNKKGAILITENSYQDFELEMEIKSAWGCDSGIILRSTDTGKGIQILNDYLKDGCVGFPFGQGTGGYISRPIMLNQKDDQIVARDVYDAVKIDRLKYAIDAEGWNKVWKTDQWNALKVRCVGEAPLITTWINGVKIMEMDGSTYTARSLKNETAQNWEAPPAWNQKKVASMTGGKGFIGVQVHGGRRWKQGETAAYRHIRIRDLSSEKK